MNARDPRGPRPAGFWIRTVAVLVDGVVIALARLGTALVVARVWGREIDTLPVHEGLDGFFVLLFACIYATAAHAATGQTIGKALVGIRVVGVDGQLLPVGASLLRWLAIVASAIPLGMGFVMAGLRVDRRALHDLIAGSRVEWIERGERLAADTAAGTREGATGPPATAWPLTGAGLDRPPSTSPEAPRAPGPPLSGA